MSGGSFDYAYGKVEQIADDVAVPDQLRWEGMSRNALARLLRAIGGTLHSLEWWKSGDTNAGDFISSCAGLLPLLDLHTAELKAALALVKPCDGEGCTRGYLPAPVDGCLGCRKCWGTGFLTVGGTRVDGPDDDSS